MQLFQRIRLNFHSYFLAILFGLVFGLALFFSFAFTASAGLLCNLDVSSGCTYTATCSAIWSPDGPQDPGENVRASLDDGFETHSQTLWKVVAVSDTHTLSPGQSKDITCECFDDADSISTGKTASCPLPEPELINGGWSDWSACSVTACGSTGTQTRTCTNPTPSGGGTNCSGDSSRSCSTPACTGSPTVYTLRVSSNGSGSVSGTGINCGSDCTESYVAGTNVSLTGSPANNYSLSSWLGCDSTPNNICNVIMNSNKTVIATFSTSNTPPSPTPSPPGAPTCTASFTPNNGESGTPSTFSWSSVNDADGIIPFSCTGSLNVPDGKLYGVTGSTNINIPPDSQVCYLTVQNSVGTTNTCYAEITTTEITIPTGPICPGDPLCPVPPEGGLITFTVTYVAQEENCVDRGDCPPPTPPSPDGNGPNGGGGLSQSQCEDTIDNDGDGWIDLIDPGCTDSDDNDETGGTSWQCSDGLDNDGDGFIDGNDPHCSNPQDNTEASPIFREF